MGSPKSAIWRRADACARQAVHTLRRTEGVLVRRAKGFKIERIAYEIRVSAEDVKKILRLARKRGEPRALGDREAAAAAAIERNDPILAAEIAAGEPEPAPAPKPVPVSPPPAPVTTAVVETAGPEASIDPARLARDPAARRLYVAMLRDRAGRVPAAGIPMSPGRAGLHHLADLYEHCDSFYPSARIVSDGLTAIRILPEPLSFGGGAGQLCAEA